MGPGTDTTMRPDDGDALLAALRQARSRAAVPLVFGGAAREGTLCLSEFIGLRTPGLRHLRVLAHAGLGGHVMASRRPAGVRDYKSAATITHDYDRPVLAEGIRSVVAVPVVVSGAVRGVLYGATRSLCPLGDRVTDGMVDASRGLVRELTVRDEVDRRLRLLRAAEGNRAAGRPGAEDVRELHAELRDIAHAVEDEGLRARLYEACRRLTGLTAPPEAGSAPSLSRRELDVLAHVALGCGNAEIGARLSLERETVKSYLRSAMRKLDVHSRYEAVVTARRYGLLP